MVEKTQTAATDQLGKREDTGCGVKNYLVKMIGLRATSQVQLPRGTIATKDLCGFVGRDAFTPTS